MGAGCSSPLRRLGGKRGKPGHRESSSALGEGAPSDNNNDDNQAGQGNSICRQQPTSSSPTGLSKQQHKTTTSQQQKYILDNENTEIIDDHASTVTYYTDGKNNNEDNSASLDPKSSTTTAACGGAGSDAMAPLPTGCSLGSGSAAARIIGLNGGYMAYDRHLLVSPALSPAPSTCYSPSPAAASTNSVSATTMLDLNELNEAFKTLTFGLPDHELTKEQQQLNQKRIRQPDRQNLSELHNRYARQLVQPQENLFNFISVIFISTDKFQSIDDNSTLAIDTELLAKRIESNLKSYCDEHLFNLRFLDLSYRNLSEHCRVNNLPDASMRILEQEYQDNSQQIVIIILSNVNNFSISSTDNASNGNNSNLDKRQLPTQIEAHSFSKLQDAILQEPDGTASVDLLKRWYNQVANIYYLNPIYLVHQKISSNSKEERDKAWQDWLNDASQLINIISNIQEKNPELANEIKFTSLFSSYIDYISNEPVLQKRTLLIRKFSQPMNSNTLSNQQQSSILGQSKLNEFARILADPNKLNIKRSSNDGEFEKIVNDWILDNFNKFADSIIENHIVSGRNIPFIERNLFVELTRQRHCLESYLENVTESFEARCHTFYNNQISPILNCTVDGTNIRNSSASSNDSNTNDSQQAQSTGLSANHLVFISGPKGCGKSSLFAQLIKFVAQDFFNRAQIIYRFCGVTFESLTPNRLLRSICEQFCQTQGENITAASYIYSARNEIINSLNKITKQQATIVLLDGFSSFKPPFNENDLDWLCELEANPRLKFIIMLETDSELYKKALCSYNDATYISLDHPSITEWAQMLTSTARSQRFNSATSLYDEIKNLDVSQESKEIKLTYKDFSDIIHMCRIRKLNNESIYPELSVKMIQNNPLKNLKNVQQVVISHLHYLVRPYQLCSFFIILNSSRYGLKESDIIDIMSFISEKSPKLELPKFTQTLLQYVKIQIQPWLIYISCDNAVRLTLQRDFLTKAIEFYVPNIFPNIVTEVGEVLIEYFSGRARPKNSSFVEGSQDKPISATDRLWLATQSSELINLLVLTNPTKAKEYILNRHQFFIQFLYSSMPEEFIEDCEILKENSTKKNSIQEDLQCLVNYIKQSVYPLRYDGSQIYSQIYCRSYEHSKVNKSIKSKKLIDLLNISSCPPIMNLMPISEISINSFIRARIGLNQPLQANVSSSYSLNAPTLTANQRVAKSSESHQSANQHQMKQKIYTIKDNHRHVIIIYPDKSSLSVWDIFEEKAVRTINNIDQPRDLRMIDKKRAVILCNRELRVYDLDSGQLLNKLKGVMNQKMPFFEIFGDNYVVALARNRMCVNLLNINTGELETTFKVGEDRFLNSLLVSAVGGICVCGDETQKPFPLLVWNLNERRLMYDLRIEKHEFLTRMSAISDDGHFVVSVCRQIGDSDGGASTGSSTQKTSPNFIVIYDLNSGTLFKKWKPGIDTCSVAISLSANKSGKVVNAIMNNTILIWDLATGSRRHTLMGHSAPVDVIRVQNNRVFSMDSTCRDQSLRIWDIEEGHCLAVFSPDAPISGCQMSIRGDALVCGFAAETRLSTLVICKNETVSDVVKRNKRRKSSKSLYIFDEPPSRKSSS